MKILQRGLLGGLLAAFLFACPAFAADHYFDADGGDNANAPTCSQVSPCETMGQANTELGTASAGDNFYFERGDTWTGADFATLAPTVSGTNGNPITISAYGAGNDPIFDASGSANAIDIDGVDWIVIDNIDACCSENDSTGDMVIRLDDAQNITIQNGSARDTDNEPSGITSNGCIVTTGALSDNLTVQNMVNIGGCEGPGVNITWSNDALIDSNTFTGCSREGDQVIVNNQNPGIDNATISNNSFDDACLHANAENAIDIKVGTGHVISGNTFVACQASCLLLHHGNLTGDDPSFTLSDNVIGDTDGGALMAVEDTATVVSQRNIYVMTSGDPMIRVGAGATGASASLTTEADTFEIPTGIDTTEMFELRAGTFVCNNSTAIMRNGAGAGVDLIHMEDMTTVDLNNCIFDGAGVVLAHEDAGSTATITGWNSNLWYGDAAPTTIFDLVGEGNLDADDVGTVSPVDNDTFGDPDFVSEDETSNKYLMLNTGSPGIGVGNAANLYDGAGSKDLLGYPFNGTTPNAGARSQRIQLKVTSMACECALTDVRDSRFIMDCECVQ